MYAHSIPWAVVGKKKAKLWLVTDKKKLNAHWSNDFDIALQSCQSRETLGIPVGPDTSRLIAELLLAAVEKEPRYQAIVRGQPALRLVDDFMIGFDDVATAELALGELRNSVWEYNLQLNDSKTSISASALVYREKWKLDFRRFLLSERNRRSQLSGIRDLLDLTLQSCVEAKSATPATWCCRRLSQLQNPDWNLTVVLESMFRLARDYASCTSYVAEFLINNRALCSSPDYASAISHWIKSTLKKHLRRGHHYETSWALVVAGVFKIKLDEQDLPADAELSSITLAILGMLRERGVVSVPLSRWKWRAGFTTADIYGENWLLFYESVRRGWTRDKTIASAIKADPTLAGMLAAKVTFLDDRIFDAGFIDLARRIFSPTRKTRKAKRIGQLVAKRIRTGPKVGSRRPTPISFFSDYE